MSSVSTAFKVHYNQKLGTHPAILGTQNSLWGDRRPWPKWRYRQQSDKKTDIYIL